MDAPAPPPVPQRRRQLSREVIISVRDIVVGFGERVILNHLDLDVYKGEILGFVGTSGGGKSVLTRTILGLVPKTSGKVEVFGQDLDHLNERNDPPSSGVGACCSSRARSSRP